MTKRNEIYHCPKCGSVMEVLNLGAHPVCCGTPMQLMQANTTDASQEKHVPIITPIPGGYKIAIGSTVHPMTPDHYIQWIELHTIPQASPTEPCPNAPHSPLSPESTHCKLSSEKPLSPEPPRCDLSPKKELSPDTQQCKLSSKEELSPDTSQYTTKELHPLHEILRCELSPNSLPEATFMTQSHIIFARAYCNLHGLWQTCYP